MFDKKDKRWKFSNEFLALDEGIINAVPDIDSDPGPVAIIGKIKTFETKKKELDELIAACRNYPSDKPRVTLPAAETDAEFLISGGDIESLSGPNDVDQKRNLQRQAKAIETAIIILWQRHREETARLTSAACEAITPTATKIAGETFRCFEQLLSQLEIQRQFYNLLDRKGLPAMRRPSHWCLTFVEERLVFGGAGQPNLRWFLDERKKYWGLGD